MLSEVPVPIQMESSMTGAVGTRSLSFATAAGDTGVIDAVLTRIATVIVANCPACGTTALDSTFFAWPTTAVMASHPVWRTAAVYGTSAGIFATYTSANPTLRTAFDLIDTILLISATGATVITNLFFPTALTPKAYSIRPAIVTMLALKTTISLVSSAYYSQIFIINTLPPLSASVNNGRLITQTFLHAFLVIYFA
jgi:hypothetical protein